LHHSSCASFRLTPTPYFLEQGNRDIVSGRAEEKRRLPGGTFYAIWAGDVVKKEIHKGVGASRHCWKKYFNDITLCATEKI